MLISNLIIEQLIILVIGLSTTGTGTVPQPRNPPPPKLGFVETNFIQQNHSRVYSLEFTV